VPEDVLFEARDLVHSWKRGGQRVLDGASLSIRTGDLLGIQGPSGRGKTTLARVLGGYIQPVGGQVLLDGHPIPQGGPSPVQVVFQHAETAVDPRWRIRRILTEGWRPDPGILDRFGIAEDWMDRFPHELSGGELQRVAIVRSLLPDLKVLIADELTAMHDALNQAVLWRALMETAKERGFVIIAISHDAPLLKAIEARTVALVDGTLRPV
jgi:peptide/nickel transport system ATP-binding protein